MGAPAIPLRAVETRAEPSDEELLAELVAQHDRAEEIVRRTKALIRPVARRWADKHRQMTMPSLDQLRREFGGAR